MSDKDLMNLLEPITRKNIHELKPGEWIWDNWHVYRMGHTRESMYAHVPERIGFRMISLLDLKYFEYSNKPFMLTDVDDGRTGGVWPTFKEDRFYRFKRKD